MTQQKEYDIVAIEEDFQATHKETQETILLRKGQVGTIVMDFEGEAFLVDFADETGVTYAMETLPKDRLIPLLYEPVLIENY